jgi:hypothetical protein
MRMNEKNDTSPGASELWFDPRNGSEKTFLWRQKLLEKRLNAVETPA